MPTFSLLLSAGSVQKWHVGSFYIWSSGFWGYFVTLYVNTYVKSIHSASACINKGIISPFFNEQANKQASCIKLTSLGILTPPTIRSPWWWCNCTYAHENHQATTILPLIIQLLEWNTFLPNSHAMLTPVHSNYPNIVDSQWLIEVHRDEKAQGVWKSAIQFPFSCFRLCNVTTCVLRHNTMSTLLQHTKSWARPFKLIKITSSNSGSEIRL